MEFSLDDSYAGLYVHAKRITDWPKNCCPLSGITIEVSRGVHYEMWPCILNGTFTWQPKGMKCPPWDIPSRLIPNP